jgi:multidrug resistance protein, MATE family
MSLSFTAIASPRTRAEIRATIKLATPVAAAQTSMMFMGLVDMVMIGPLGAVPLAAVSVANAIFLMLAIFCLGVVMALDAMIAQAVGAGDHARTGELLWQGVWLSIAMGLGISAVFQGSEWMFVALQQEPAVARQAASYIGPRAIGAVPFLAFAACRGFLNGHGNMRPVLVIAVVANVVNAGADWLLIYGHFGAPALGVAGAGWATAIVRWFMMLAVVVPLVAPDYRASVARVRWPNALDLRAIVRVGIPIGGNQATEMAVFSAIAVMAGWLGAVQQAAHQIAMTLAAMAYHVPVGIAIAASVRVGQAVGRGDPDAAALSGRVALGLGAAVMAFGAAIFLLLPGPLTAAFSPPDDVREIAVHLLYLAAAFQVSDGLQVVAGGALRGAGDTRSSFFANAIAHWTVGLPLGYWLAFKLGMGIDGLWWGVTASLTVAAVLLSWLFVRGDWRRIGRIDRRVD